MNGMNGIIMIRADRIVVKCVPHVMIKLRRWFKKAGRDAEGTASTSLTDENASEMRWMGERFSLEVEEISKEMFNEAADRWSLREQMIREVLAPGYVPQAFELALPPREYQRVAAEALLRSQGLLLADDLGLGKTVSAICALTDKRMRPCLIVAPAHLIRQWSRELCKFAPFLTHHVLRKSTPYLIPGGRTDVLLTTYHKLDGWADHLTGQCQSVIFDEIAELRHRGSKRYEAAVQIARKAKYRLGMSATPVYNMGGEIFNVLDVVMPGQLGTQKEFVEEWCAGGGNTVDKAKLSDPAAMGSYLRSSGLMLRRTRAEVGRELPAMSKFVQEIDVDQKAFATLGSNVAELARLVMQGPRSGDQAAQMAYLKASTELDWKLRQATGIAKAPYVADFVRMLVDSGERVVLFGWHHAVFDIWMKSLETFKPAKYTGEESASQKDGARRRFIEKETPILIMSLRAGAGVDGLQSSARTTVHGELDWSPAVHDQCDGRLHRDGQRESVFSYFLTAAEGSDPVVADVLGLKAVQQAGIRDPLLPLSTPRVDGAGHVQKLAQSWLERYAQGAMPMAALG